MVWNNQQRPIGSAPLPEVHAYTQNKPKFDGGLSKTHPQGNSKKGRKQRRRNKNPKLVFPTRVRTFPNKRMTNLCVRSVVVIATLQRNVVPQVILLIST